MGIRQQFHDKPWLFVVFGLALFLGMSIAFLVIALLNPPDML